MRDLIIFILALMLVGCESEEMTRRGGKIYYKELKGTWTLINYTSNSDFNDILGNYTSDSCELKDHHLICKSADRWGGVRDSSVTNSLFDMKIIFSDYSANKRIVTYEIVSNVNGGLKVEKETSDWSRDSIPSINISGRSLRVDQLENGVLYISFEDYHSSQGASSRESMNMTFLKYR
jgi:hypothetical protein